MRPHESAACQASLSITNSRSSPKLMCIELVMSSSHLILCHPLFLLLPIPPSIRVFSNESTLRMKWPKYWSFSFNICLSPSSEHPGLISFRMDWLDLLAVQGTLKSLHGPLNITGLGLLKRLLSRNKTKKNSHIFILKNITKVNFVSFYRISRRDLVKINRTFWGENDEMFLHERISLKHSS